MNRGIAACKYECVCFLEFLDHYLPGWPRQRRTCSSPEITLAGLKPDLHWVSVLTVLHHNHFSSSIANVQRRFQSFLKTSSDKILRIIDFINYLLAFLTNNRFGVILVVLRNRCLVIGPSVSVYRQPQLSSGAIITNVITPVLNKQLQLPNNTLEDRRLFYPTPCIRQTLQDVCATGSRTIDIAVKLCLQICLLTVYFVSTTLSTCPTNLLVVAVCANICKEKDAN
jgi:hypothetical protein